MMVLSFIKTFTDAELEVFTVSPTKTASPFLAMRTGCPPARSERINAPPLVSTIAPIASAASTGEGRDEARRLATNTPEFEAKNRNSEAPSDIGKICLRMVFRLSLVYKNPHL
jgi:hypothetical protein